VAVQLRVLVSPTFMPSSVVARVCTAVAFRPAASKAASEGAKMVSFLPL
jgi:hypothetical protein